MTVSIVAILYLYALPFALSRNQKSQIRSSLIAINTLPSVACGADPGIFKGGPGFKIGGGLTT